MTVPFSAILITLNAEKHLENCLQSLQLANEIVIVDSGSTDQTISIAKRYNAKIIHKDWLGFGPQKQFAVSLAKNDWVLCLDADEWLSEELSHSIQQLQTSPSFMAYDFPRCNRFLGRFLRHGEGYPDRCLRFFHRDFANWSDDLVHEFVKTQTKVGALKGDLMHDSSESLSKYLSKQNRYTDIQAEILFQKGKKPSYIKLILSPLVRFIKFYFIRQGFRDGLPGLIHITIGCINGFIKYAKTIEKMREENK